MKRVVSILLCVVMLFAPVSQALGDSIEVKGDLYNKLGLPRGDGPKDLTLVQGQFGAGLAPVAGACGINAISSFLAGLTNIASLGQLGQFISDWRNAMSSLILYWIATSMPVAKEVLLGLNTISHFAAQLRGFSCAQVMEAIKEFNYQDSYLIKMCISKKLGVSMDDVDLVMKTDPKTWYKYYKECLKNPNLLNLLGEDAVKYVKFISPRSLARCYLGVKEKLSPQDIAKADLQTKAKYFLYMVLPDITIDVNAGNGRLKIQTVNLSDLGIVNDKEKDRPVTMIDVVNLHVENFVEDYNQLIKNLKSVIKFEMGYDDALEAAKPHFDEFERKYGISLEDMAPTLILVLRMRDYLQKNADKGFTYAVDLQNLDYVLGEYIKKVYLDKALQRLELALSDYLIRLKQAETIRKSVGSGSIPGDSDGCFNSSSGGST
jgi:hypothetical protein